MNPKTAERKKRKRPSACPSEKNSQLNRREEGGQIYSVMGEVKNKRQP